MEEGCVLRNCHIHIDGNANRIILNKHVHAINAEIWIEDDDNAVVIGENTSLCGKIHLACIEGQSIVIGKNCLFSSDIVIRTGDSHSILDENGNRINPSKPVIIGDHVWVGHRAIIGKGTVVPKNCMIGTSAVVTKAFHEEGAIIAGVPAKVIKRNIGWDAKRLPV